MGRKNKSESTCYAHVVPHNNSNNNNNLLHATCWWQREQTVAEAAACCTLLWLLQLLKRNVVAAAAAAVLNATFVGSFFVVCVAIVSKTCAAASHLCGKVCPLLPPPLLLSILCMFNELPPNLLPQIDAG